MAEDATGTPRSRGESPAVGGLRLHTIFEHAAPGIAITSADGIIVQCNPAYGALLGYTQEELRRIPLASLLHPEDRDTERAEIQRLRAGKVAVVEIENRYVHRSGRPLQVCQWISLLPDEAGQPTYLLRLVVARAKPPLPEREEWLHLVADALPVLIAYVGADGGFQFNNAAYEQWFGQPAAAFQGRSLREVLGEAVYARIQGHVQAALAGHSCTFETQIPYQGVGLRDVLMHSIPHRHPGGQVLGFFALILDLSERKQAEEAIRQSEERLRAILNAAEDAIITVTAEGIIQSVNPATERMFGYTAAEMIGRDVSMLLPPSHRDTRDGDLLRYLQTRVAHGIGIEKEVEAWRSDGTAFPVEVAVSQVDQLPLFTGILHDVSRRKELEREVVELVSLEQRRIGQDLHDSVAQELTALKLLVDDLAEALRTDPASGAPLVERMGRGLRRTQEQLRAVLRGLLPVAVDAGGLMAALADLADRTSQEGKVTCVFDCPEPISVADNLVATHLYLIAQEAVHNAVKHARSRNIRIMLTANRYLVLSVTDDGVGLPTRPTELQGLGLRIMQDRAAIIGAELTLGPAEPTGTVVTCVVERKRNDR